MIIGDDPPALARQTADWIADTIAAAKGTFRLVLSGGDTPIPLFDALAELEPAIEWKRVEFFWADERVVPWNDPRSNYGAAKAHLLSRLPLQDDLVHPIPTDGLPADCAERYQTLLMATYGGQKLDTARPLFNLVLLGLGEDGHVASLFPGQPVLDERDKWVVSTPGQTEPRITLTFPVLESSAQIAFYVTGSEKRPVLQRVLSGDYDAPATRLGSQRQTIWFLDRAAAGA